MNTRSFFSIRFKVLILLYFCILIPFLFYWFYSYHYIRTSLDEEFVSQTTSSMTSAGSSISDYIRIADAAARGLYFNSELMDILSEERSSDASDYDILYTESKIFDFLQTLYSSIPEASQIHLSAFNLKKSLLLQSDMKRYERDHIYLNQERMFPCTPYRSYVTAAHMQSDYHFLNLADQEFNPVFTVHMPIYKIPSASDVLGEISIDIPISALEEICQPVYQDQETLYIIDGMGNYVYSSRRNDVYSKTENPEFLHILSDSQSKTAQLAGSGSDNIIIYSRLPFEPHDWYLIKSSPKSFVYAKADHFFNQMLYTFIGVTAAEILFIFIAVLHFTSPLQKATSYAEAVTAGNLNARMSDYITYTHNDELGKLLIAIRKMILSIRNFTIRQYQLELANRTSELKALQAQINPHFIHNTLQCLATNALEGGNLPLYHSITDLGQMMHYSMNTRQNLVPLEDALHYISLYLQLQKMRFPSSIVSDFQIQPEARKLLIPKMSLQPLVENSIRHGNLLKQEDSRLTIKAYLENHFFHIWVEDTGTGITFEKMEEINEALREVRASMDSLDAASFMDPLDPFSPAAESSPEEEKLRQAKDQRYVSASIGVRNVYQRLLLYFKNQCFMEFMSNDVCGTTVHIQLDYRMLESEFNGKDNRK